MSSGKYDDLLPLPHPVSKVHPRMSRQDRAAQFSPFAALTGYEAVIQEAARRTEEQRELSEQELMQLDDALHRIREILPARPLVELRYFEHDPRKEGGAYRTLRGRIRRIDEVARVMILQDGRVLPLCDLESLALVEEPRE